MRSASIIGRGKSIIIHPWSKTVTGVGLGTRPFIVLDRKEEPQKIGQAIREALEAVQSGLPHPEPDEWEIYDKPLYQAAGVKSWSVFVKGAVSSSIIEHETELEFAPQLNRGSRGGFQPAGIESLKISRKSNAILIGETALRSLDLAKAAESNPPPKKVLPAIEDLLPQITREAGGDALETAPEAHLRLLEDLERLGFFRYVEPDRLKQERMTMLRLGWVGIFGENGRLFFADAEELTEGGVAEFVDEVRSFLEAQRLSVPPLEDEFDMHQEYILVAGGERLPIWTRDEYERDSSLPGLLWGLSATRTVQILNRWLERAGSPERAYGVNAGNDFAVFFLTPELYERICRDPEASPYDGPYVPSLAYPLFGFPQSEGD